MKIVIENIKFNFDIGCKLLKLRYADCPFSEGYVAEIWNDIIPATFGEIAQLENLEQRRVGVMCLGLERLINEVKPTLVDKKTLKKTTTWINENGEIETKKFNDTYELYSVSGENFNKGLSDWGGRMTDCHFVKCKDTSTDREYMIWVDLDSVKDTNGINRWDTKAKKVTAIDCIAWTIQTNIPEGKIEKIVRQGDCILIKPNGRYEVLNSVRHLTTEEYKTLLVAES
jgi:hypothetical protein